MTIGFKIRKQPLLFLKAMHKYIKRTGGKGNYKYWYKVNGKLVEGKKPEKKKFKPKKSKGNINVSSKRGDYVYDAICKLGNIKN